MRRLLATTAVALAAVAVVTVFVLVTEVFLLAFAGVLFAVFLRGLTAWVGRVTRLPETPAFTAVLGALFLVMFLGSVLVAPGVAEQVDMLSRTLPETVARVYERMQDYEIGRRFLRLTETVTIGFDPAVVEQFTRFAATTLGLLGSFLVVLAIGLFLSLRPRWYADGVVTLFPVESRPRARHVLGRLESTLGWWLTGKIISMTFVGVTVGAGLAILGIPLAPLLAVLAGLFEFIPNFGPIIAAIPAVLFAFVEGGDKALIVIVLYVVIQSLQSYVVDPLVQQKMVSLPPALLLLAQIFFALLFGFLGLLLATPLLAALLTFVRTVYVEGVLGGAEEG